MPGGSPDCALIALSRTVSQAQLNGCSVLFVQLGQGQLRIQICLADAFEHQKVGFGQGVALIASQQRQTFASGQVFSGLFWRALCLGRGRWRAVARFTCSGGGGPADRAVPVVLMGLMGLTGLMGLMGVLTPCRRRVSIPFCMGLPGWRSEIALAVASLPWMPHFLTGARPVVSLFRPLRLVALVAFFSRGRHWALIRSRLCPTGRSRSPGVAARGGACCRPARCTLCLAPGLDNGAAAFELYSGGGLVFFADLARCLAVQVKAVLGCQQCADVGGAGGVAMQKDRQRLLVEQARGSLLDVGLDAQLDRQRFAGGEQRREALGQRCGAGGWRQICNGWLDRGSWLRGRVWAGPSICC